MTLYQERIKSFNTKNKKLREHSTKNKIYLFNDFNKFVFHGIDIIREKSIQTWFKIQLHG